MQPNTTSSRNLRSLLLLMVLSGSLVSGAFTIKQDIWLAVLLMGVLFLPAVFIYSRITALLPGKGLFDIIEALFGRVISFVLILLISLYALLTSSLVLQNYTEFTVVISLQDTPKIPIMIVLVLPALYLAQKGIRVFGRWALIICVLILCHFVMTLILSANIMEPAHILPLASHSLIEIVDESFALGSIAVGETMIVLSLFGYLKKGESPYKIYVPGILLGVLLFTLVVLRNLFILGADLEQAAHFSTYMAVRIIRIGSFLERVESTISFIYILLGITKLTLYFSAASMGIAKLLRVPDHRRLLVPSALIVLALGSMVFKNVMEMYDFVWVSRFLSMPFQVLIPLIIWIAAEIKTRQWRKGIERKV